MTGPSLQSYDDVFTALTAAHLFSPLPVYRDGTEIRVGDMTILAFLASVHKDSQKGTPDMMAARWMGMNRHMGAVFAAAGVGKPGQHEPDVRKEILRALGYTETRGGIFRLTDQHRVVRAS